MFDTTPACMKAKCASFLQRGEHTPSPLPCCASPPNSPFRRPCGMHMREERRPCFFTAPTPPSISMPQFCVRSRLLFTSPKQALLFLPLVYIMFEMCVCVSGWTDRPSCTPHASMPMSHTPPGLNGKTYHLPFHPPALHAHALSLHILPHSISNIRPILPFYYFPVVEFLFYPRK